MHSKNEQTLADDSPLLQLSLEKLEYILRLILASASASKKNTSEIKNNLISSCKQMYGFFENKQNSINKKDSWAKRKPLPTVNDLLEAIAKGVREKQHKNPGVKKIVTLFPNLLLNSGKVTAMGGQIVTKSTPLAHAIWGFDMHAWNLLLDVISQGKVDLYVVSQLLEQAKNSIRLNAYFDYMPSIIAYKACIYRFQKYESEKALYKPFGLLDWQWKGTLGQHFRELDILFLNIGKEQAKWPVALRQEFCRRDRALYPTPTFDDKYLPQTLKFVLYKTLEKKVWDGNSSQLGTQFSIVRGWVKKPEHKKKGARAWTLMGSTLALSYDLAALEAYIKVRTQRDLPVLIERLENLLQVLTTESKSQDLLQVEPKNEFQYV